MREGFFDIYDDVTKRIYCITPLNFIKNNSCYLYRPKKQMDLYYYSIYSNVSCTISLVFVLYKSILEIHEHCFFSNHLMQQNVHVIILYYIHKV